jgi:hypothetical protein
MNAGAAALPMVSDQTVDSSGRSVVNVPIESNQVDLLQIDPAP